MKKLIWISEKENIGITYWFLKKISNVEKHDIVKGEEAEEIIDKESTDFLYLNIKRSANTDVMNRLCLRNINRLRVSIFKFDEMKFSVLKFFLPPQIIKD
jgi:hypothetical protein